MWNCKDIKCRYGNCTKTTISLTIPLTCQAALPQKHNLQHKHAQQKQGHGFKTPSSQLLSQLLHLSVVVVFFPLSFYLVIKVVFTF